MYFSFYSPALPGIKTTTFFLLRCKMGMRLGVGKALQMFTVFSAKLHFDNNHFSLLWVHLGKVHTHINRQN